MQSSPDAADDDAAAMGLREGSAPKARGREGHSLPVVILTVVAVILYIVSLLFPNSERWGWLPTSVGNASDDHPTYLTPASYAFTIWIVIFLWQMLWLLYALVNLCRWRGDRSGNRSGDRNGPAYLNPPIAVGTALYMGSYIAALVAICVWYFVWTYGIMWLSLIVIAVIPVSVWTCVALLVRSLVLVEHENEFARRVDLWIYRVLVLNGLSIFATWTSIATHINIAIVIIYDIGAAVATGSIVALVILLIVVGVFTYLDLFYWDRYLRYNLITFPVVIWASSAVISERKHFGSDDEEEDPDVDASFVLTAVILAVGCAAFALKVALLVLRTLRGRSTREIV